MDCGKTGRYSFRVRKRGQKEERAITKNRKCESAFKRCSVPLMIQWIEKRRPPLWNRKVTKRKWLTPKTITTTQVEYESFVNDSYNYSISDNTSDKENACVDSNLVPTTEDEQTSGTVNSNHKKWSSENVHRRKRYGLRSTNLSLSQSIAIARLFDMNIPSHLSANFDEKLDYDLVNSSYNEESIADKFPLRRFSSDNKCRSFKHDVKLSRVRSAKSILTINANRTNVGEKTDQCDEPSSMVKMIDSYSLMSNNATTAQREIKKFRKHRRHLNETEMGKTDQFEFPVDSDNRLPNSVPIPDENANSPEEFRGFPPFHCPQLAALIFLIHDALENAK